jgi:protein-S-isoprenylcysteine O-methyltransferase Ste14
MYLGSLLLLWFSPNMTDSLLALCICITGYFFLGSIHEEKLLVHEFGEEYRVYRKKAGRILPFLP